MSDNAFLIGCMAALLAFPLLLVGGVNWLLFDYNRTLSGWLFIAGAVLGLVAVWIWAGVRRSSKSR